MRFRWMRPRRLILLASTGLSLVALSACGSSGGFSNSANADPGVKFAGCMRAHGVSSFPDPTPGGGIQIPDGVNPRAPAFQSAQRACSKLMPGGGPLHGHASEQQKLMMLHLSQCMRQHGFPDFPDPIATPPGPGAGFGIAFGAPGSFIAVPQAMLQSPGFQQAAGACGFPGAARLRLGKK